MNREEVLQWCVINIDTWPKSLNDDLPVPDVGWRWVHHNDTKGVTLLETNSGGVSVTREDWQIVKRPQRAAPTDQVHKPKEMSREEALQWCVDNIEEWTDKSIRDKGHLIAGWEYSLIPGGIIISHSTHNPIYRQDWQAAKLPTSDQVHQPKHYEVLDGFEAIEVIASSLTREQWKGYCVGNIVKYRLRAGKKDALQQDIDKANECEMLFEKYKELNRAK